jgi:hypothetical protein
MTASVWSAPRPPVEAPAAAHEHEERAANLAGGPFGALVAGDVAGDLDLDVLVVADVVRVL